jgi:hypothetical protein
MEQDTGKAERILQHSRALGADMRDLANDVAEVGRDLRQRVDLSRSVQEHPFRVVLIATGVGYVLGGGLFTPLTGQIVRAGARALLLPILRNQLEATLTGTQREPGEQG